MRDSVARAALAALQAKETIRIEYDAPWFWQVSISRSKRPEEAPSPKERTVSLFPPLPLMCAKAVEAERTMAMASFCRPRTGETAWLDLEEEVEPKGEVKEAEGEVKEEEEESGDVSSWAKKKSVAAKRATTNDFGRFRAMFLKKKRSQLIKKACPMGL